MIPVVLCREFLRRLEGAPTGDATRVLRVVDKLRSRRYDGGLRVKKLRGNPRVAVWEARASDAARVLFTLARVPMRGSEGIQVREAIQLWDIVFDHDRVDRCVRRSQWLSSEVLSEREWRSPLPNNPTADLMELAKNHSDDELWDAYECLSEEYPSPIDDNDSNLEWYVTREEDWRDPRALLAIAHRRRIPLELLLVREQYDLLRHPLPLVITGSAGSGKTTVALYKMHELARRAPAHRIAYVTYGRHLVAHAAELFRSLPTAVPNPQRVKFLTYEELLSACLQRNTGQQGPFLAGYPTFLEFFRKHGGKHREAPLAWSEIRAIIKGSLPPSAVSSHYREVHELLPLQEYRDLPDSWGYVSAADREAYYRLACGFQEHLSRRGMMDEQDLASRVLQSPVPADLAVEGLVLDEIQDLTQKQLHVVMRFLRSPSGALLAGDPTQTLQPTSMCWRQIHDFFHRTGSSRPHTCSVTRNFRCSKPITNLGQLLSRLLTAAGAEDVARLEETSRIDGDVPSLVPLNRDLLDQLREPAPGRAVIVADGDTRDSLVSELGHPLVWSIADAKGLEFDEVVIYGLDASLDMAVYSVKEAAGRARRLEALRQLQAIYVAVTRARRALTIALNPTEGSLWNDPTVREHLQVNAGYRTPHGDRDASTWLSRAHYYREREQWAAALACFRQAASEAWARAMEACLLADRGELESAQQLLAHRDLIDPEVGRFLKTHRPHLLAPPGSAAAGRKRASPTPPSTGRRRRPRPAIAAVSPDPITDEELAAAGLQRISPRSPSADRSPLPRPVAVPPAGTPTPSDPPVPPTVDEPKRRKTSTMADSSKDWQYDIEGPLTVGTLREWLDPLPAETRVELMNRDPVLTLCSIDGIAYIPRASSHRTARPPELVIAFEERQVIARRRMPAGEEQDW